MLSEQTRHQLIVALFAAPAPETNSSQRNAVCGRQRKPADSRRACAVGSAPEFGARQALKLNS